MNSKILCIGLGMRGQGEALGMAMRTMYRIETKPEVLALIVTESVVILSQYLRSLKVPELKVRFLTILDNATNNKLLFHL